MAGTISPTPGIGSGGITKIAGIGSAGISALIATPSGLVADFTGTPLTGTTPLEVTFTDTSAGTPTGWFWEKNNGSGWIPFAGTPYDQNPVEDFFMTGDKFELTLPKPEVRGNGRITDPKTGKTTQFYIGESLKERQQELKEIQDGNTVNSGT